MILQLPRNMYGPEMMFSGRNLTLNEKNLIDLVNQVSHIILQRHRGGVKWNLFEGLYPKLVPSSSPRQIRWLFRRRAIEICLPVVYFRVGNVASTINLHSVKLQINRILLNGLNIVLESHSRPRPRGPLSALW